MVTVKQMNAVLVIAAVAAFSVLAVLLRRRMRRRTRPGCWGPDDKPQRRFKRVLADNSDRPFKHLQREGHGKDMSLKTHPYEQEISLLLAQSPTITKSVTSHQCPDMGASYVWIHTKQQLDVLARLLSKEQAFAVDTEQHSVRSFLGFTALMQISTEKEDFLIDTIVLHDVMGILRPIFADPTILKVFHGSGSDILWLQRDFHIYVVNMFDTAKACEVLSKPYNSLACLLETYCDVSSDKTFQREDWRQRPLSEDMIQYARCDVHYLLYIADCLASELKNETHASSDDKYNEARRRSNMVSLQLYVKKVQSSLGTTFSSNCEIKDRIWKIRAWRDLMAQIHDDSLKYVLSEIAIVALAAKFPKEPMEVCDVIAEADSSHESSSINSVLPSPSPVVTFHLNELCCLLQETTANLNDDFFKYLQKHLAPTGCCPVSVYNYAISSEFSLKGKSTLFTKQSGGKFVKPVGRITSHERFVQKPSRKNPVYQNCRIYAGDGQLLCHTNKKKLQWYLERDLATRVENDPLAIMLRFEPIRRPEGIMIKKNICVGCGESKCIRYQVIPSCYRLHFPTHLKSYRAHDVILLCADCREIAHSAAEKYKEQIANEYKIPLFVRKIVNKGENQVIAMVTRSGSEVEQEGVSPGKLRTAVTALLRHGSSMPLERRDAFMQIIREYFGGREISFEDIEMMLPVGVSICKKRKKRGSHFKHSEGYVIPKTYKSSFPDATESGTNVIVKSHDSSKGTNLEVHRINSSRYDFEGVLSEEASDSIEQWYHTRNEPERGNAFTSNNLNGNENQSDGTCGSSRYLPYQLFSLNLKKESLFGQGPHGKQVVEHLLQMYGLDGIDQFCQRWRQVFLEAVRPRFLPTGWDVMNRLRREFGEHSVYNPSKRDVQ